MPALTLHLALLPALLAAVAPDAPELKTWDGRHGIRSIKVSVVYFVPRDREPLPDWRDRVGYFARRIERFHAREFGDQSKLSAAVHPEPFRSADSTAELRAGDANRIFFRTLREVDSALEFGRDDDGAFPILLVLSDINWRPLDDFYRLSPQLDGPPEFEGNDNGGQHFPGAKSGGARATYLAGRGVGWGLVSADGWRVPYRGSDCVVYHEGVGHPIGLPHTDAADPNVMSMGQYHGWISESWVDEAQKRRLGWKPPEKPVDRARDLFSAFRALPEPTVPRPGEPVTLNLDWPEGVQLASCRVRYQTELLGPWHEVDREPGPEPPRSVSLGAFDRPTPVSYRVEATTKDGDSAELWGYFQVRTDPRTNPTPAGPLEPLATSDAEPAGEPTDLLARVDPARDAVSGEWSIRDGRLESPRQPGARIEFPGDVPDEYRLTVVAEPLDDPNGLILGQRLAGRRFLVLLDYAGSGSHASALENIDGRNVGNESTYGDSLFRKGRPATIVCDVRASGVRVAVDGHVVIDWRGDPSQLSLSDYWKTPNESLFLGAYDCRYRVHRAEVAPLE
ncbi:hypothetical protein [Paludisphaera sp.]|uniref:hypothetical protein n=1 Tax=Paludisphaera sp. TaxID=2017432 RepID=UPI00301CD4B9